MHSSSRWRRHGAARVLAGFCGVRWHSHCRGGGASEYGFIVLDKPAGLTSHDCVDAVRSVLQTRKVGHGGTLDPAATGILPIAVGPATRLLPYLDGDKSYEGEIQLGVTTSTDDLEGEVLQTRVVPSSIDSEQLQLSLSSFRGQFQQVPPAVSAVRVNGVRAYTRFRRGETISVPPRTVVVHELELQDWDACTGRLRINVRCGAGTYIRSIARDLGTQLGCGAALASLRRTAALGFTLSDAIDFETLRAADGGRGRGKVRGSNNTPKQRKSAANSQLTLRDPLQVLRHLPTRQLVEDEVERWRCGNLLRQSQKQVNNCYWIEGQPFVVLAPPNGNNAPKLAGVAQLKVTVGKLQPKLVLNLPT